MSTTGRSDQTFDRLHYEECVLNNQLSDTNPPRNCDGTTMRSDQTVDRLHYQECVLNN